MKEQESKKTPTNNDKPTLSHRRKRRGGFVFGSLLGATLASGALILAFTSAKGSPWGHRSGQSHWGHGYGEHSHDTIFREHAEERLDWILDWIDASDEQRDQIVDIVGDSIENMRQLSAEHHSNREAFVSAFAQTDVDRVALEEIRLSALQLADEASSELLDMLAEVAEVLTPEQRLDLSDHMRKRH